MKKIPTLFIRNPKNMSRVTRDVHPDCEWVMAGDGIATVKIDGTACWWHEGKLWKRYTVKEGRTPPVDFVKTGEPDPVTGKQAGWTAVGEGPEDKFHREALVNLQAGHLYYLPEEGETYELIGPKVQSNPYGLPEHLLIRHTDLICMKDIPRDFAGIKDCLGWATYMISRLTRESSERKEEVKHEGLVEGIVWHHEDGRMAKIKRKDFGLPWPVKEERR